MQISYTKKLGQLLVQHGLLTHQQLQSILDGQHQWPEQKFGQVLIQHCKISAGELITFLENHLHIPRAEIPLRVPATVLGLINESTMRRLQAFPVANDHRQMAVAMVDPLDMLAIDHLTQTTNLKIKPLLATREQLEAAISRHFDMLLLEKQLIRENNDAATQYGTTGKDSPVIRLVDGLIDQAVADGASDIHIEPQPEDVLVRYRIDGMLRGMLRLPLTSRHALVARIKILAQMDIAEKRLPQDGRFIYPGETEKIDLRVSSIPTVHGEKIVLRLLRQGQNRLTINQLGLSAANLVLFNKLNTSTNGMILVTGPTGCGKTTTLYAMLDQLNDPTKNIVTLEDPVEYSIVGINQIHIKPKTGLTFGAGLRSVLRQDPDVIMVGEIRDRETAEITTRAANTGHLVLSTLHTNSAPDAITRLLEMGVERYLVATSIAGVVAQQLVRRLCPTCRKTRKPHPQDPPLPNPAPTDKVTLYQAQGCYACGYTGYRGRIGIHEILLMTPYMSELISQHAPAAEIKAAALKGGTVSLATDGMTKVQQGITTLEEIQRVTYSVADSR